MKSRPNVSLMSDKRKKNLDGQILYEVDQISLNDVSKKKTMLQVLDFIGVCM